MLSKNSTFEHRLQHAERLLNEAASALKTLQQQLQIHQQQQPPIEDTQLIEYIHLNHEKLQQQAEQRDQFKLKLEVHQQNLAKQNNLQIKSSRFSSRNTVGIRFQFNWRFHGKGFP